MARMDVEWVAYTAGLKPALRRTVDPARAEEVAARMRASGAVVLRARETAVFGAREEVVLYVAPTERDAEALRDAEASVLPGRVRAADPSGAHRAVGRALGFPACCVDAFCARVARGVDRLVARGPGGLSEDYVAARAAWVPRPDARVNPLLMRVGAQLVSFYPCRFDCPAAVAQASALLDEVGRRSPEAARALMAALSRSVVVAADGARAQVVLEASGRVLRVAAPSREGRAAPEDEALAAALSDATVGETGEVRGRRDVRVEPPWCVRFGWGSSSA